MLLIIKKYREKPITFRQMKGFSAFSGNVPRYTNYPHER
jgi:hypothetical protein